MATYTSSQSGDFSSSATWGGAGVPGDGDRFDVSVGHTVTIDDGISVPTNGYADSYVYGILQSESGTDNTLRMNGRLYIKGGGTLHLRSGATVQIKGSSADQHGIWQENENAASVIMEGSDGMPCTTTTSALSIGDEYIPVTSASNFAIGEWISVFDNTTAYSGTNESYPVEAWEDEGFWIHDISSNNIYFRLFVSPEATIQSIQGNNKIIVDNAKVFRTGQKIIFNTGSDRNVKTIADIDYARNRITTDSSITNTGNQTGEVVYLTGIEKAHGTNSKVRKQATVTTASSANDSTTITVANITDFNVGDDIYIERRSEADGTTDYAGWWSTGTFKDMRHTISSISGNTITLSGIIDYTAVEGALVIRLSRDVVCETVATDGSDYAFYYCENTTNWNNKIVLKDVYFKNFGNDDSNVFSGVVLRGYTSTDSLPVTLTETVPSRSRSPWVEGLAVYIWPDATHQIDWGAIWSYDCRGLKIRNCVVLNGDEGIAVYYEPHVAVYNSLVAGQDNFAFRLEGPSGVSEFAYLYSSRVYYGLRLYLPYEIGKSVHNMICDSSYYAINLVHMSWAKNCLYRCKFTGYRLGMNSEHSGAGMLYCYAKAPSGYPQAENDATTRGTVQDGQFRQSNFYYGTGITLKSTEHNFEVDQLRAYGYRWEAFWDVNENAWRFFRRYDSSSTPGILDSIYVPQGATLRLSAKVKYDPDFSGTYPYLGIVDNILSNYSDFDGSGQGAHRLSGYSSTIQYTSNGASDYEEKQLTYGPFDYSTVIMAGVFSTNSNAAEGYWVKDFKAYIDIPYQSSAFHRANDSNNNTFVEVRNTFSQTKRRLGGRLK